MRSILILSFVFVSICSFSQSEIGPKLKIYPAGTIVTIQFTDFIRDHTALNYEFGYNRAVRQDFGVQANEEGGGLGFGFGVRRYANKKKKGFYAEANLETWFLKINWRANLEPCFNCQQRPETGETKITVLQPTLGVGYQIRSKDENWAASIGASFGREWNVRTNGEEVGQGGISLLVISVTRRL